MLDDEGAWDGLQAPMEHYVQGPFQFDLQALPLTAVIWLDVEMMNGKRSKPRPRSPLLRSALR